MLHESEPVQRLQVPLRRRAVRNISHAVVRPAQQVPPAQGNFGVVLILLFRCFFILSLFYPFLFFFAILLLVILLYFLRLFIY